jgi:predicted PurR-regulated permease PerM
VYIAFFGTLTLIIYFIIPLFASEIKQFSQVIPQYFEKISPSLKGLNIEALQDIDSLVSTLGEILNKITLNIMNILFVFFGGVFATIFILTLSIYISLDEKGVEKRIAIFFPKKYETAISSIWERCEKKVNGWFFTRIISCLFVGFASFLTFLIFNTPYPLSLGLISGLLNFIPVVGPVVTGIFLFIIIALESMPKAIFVLIVFTLIQQIENNILTPLLSKKMVGLPPILVLLSLSIGGILWGLLGAILAIPLAGILYEFLKEFLNKRKSEKPVIS